MTDQDKVYSYVHKRWIPADGPTPPFDYGQPSYPQRPDKPSLWPTILISFFFGLFGLIPAIRHSRMARERGYPESGYWWSFGGAFAAAFVLWVFLAVGVAIGASNTAARALNNQANVLSYCGNVSTLNQDFSSLMHGTNPGNVRFDEEQAGFSAGVAGGKYLTDTNHALQVFQANTNTGTAGVQADIGALNTLNTDCGYPPFSS